MTQSTIQSRAPGYNGPIQRACARFFEGRSIVARILGLVLAFVLVAFAAWPYYTLFRLDTALAASDPAAIGRFVDLTAIRRSYQDRLGANLDRAVSRQGADAAPVLGWLAQGLRGLGAAALERAITLEWVRDQLRAAASAATDERPAYLLAGVSGARFLSWDRFLVRLGQGSAETRVTFGLTDAGWRIGDIDQGERW